MNQDMKQDRSDSSPRGLLIAITYVFLGVLLLAMPQNEVLDFVNWFRSSTHSRFVIITMIIVSTLVESIFLLGLALPGSFIILLATLFSIQSEINPLYVCMSGVLGTSLGYALSMFVVGARSAVKTQYQGRVQNWLLNYNPAIIAFVSTILPQVAAVVAYSIGLRGERLGKYFFIMLTGTTVSVTIVYFVVLFFGNYVIRISEEGKNYFALLVLIYGSVELILFALRMKKKK